MALFAVVITGLQIWGGAYRAEYDAHADEAAHFVSSLLVRDYLAQWPWSAPLPWAMRYYLHYPKVAIGHWPPGYYVLQGLWWLIFPAGRASAMVLNVAMGLWGMGLFLTLARRIRAGWPAVVSGVVLLLLPLIQEAHAQVMAELPSLLCILLLLWSITRLLEDPRMLRVIWVVAALGAALAVKGTGVALIAAPVIAVAVSGAWRRLPLWHLLGWPALAASGVIGLYLWQYRGSVKEMLAWGGMLSDLPWQVGHLPEITGLGILAVGACGGLLALWRRDPAPLAAASILLSILFISYFVRAMRETRHWIAAVPVLVLLCLMVFTWLERRSRWACLPVLAIIVVTFPYKLYRQQPVGYTALAEQIRQPARMLISSSTGWGEGPWIAVAALREPRPSSMIVRATKLLASSDWNGREYESLVATPADVERKLDETAIDLVVLHTALSGRTLSHHPLLAATLRDSPAWKPCGVAGELAAYCRVREPAYPRRPLRMSFQQRLGIDIVETVP